MTDENKSDVSTKLLSNKRDRDVESKKASSRIDPRKILEKTISMTEKKMKRERTTDIDIDIKSKSESASASLSHEKVFQLSSINQSMIQEEKVIIQTSPNIPSLSLTTKLLMDEFGRIVDEKGNIIQIKPEAKSTLKININKEKEQRVKELLKIQKVDQAQVEKKETKFYDPSIDLFKSKREKMKSRAFNFAEKGSFQRQIEETRKRQNAKKLGIDLTSTTLTEEEEKDLLNLDILNIRPNFNRQPLQLKAIHLVPDVEWWDAYFLPANKKSFSPYWTEDRQGNWIHNPSAEIKFEDFNVREEADIMANKVTHYIQHPVPIKNENLEKLNKVNIPVFFTLQEKKKLRRLRRLEKEKEKQEQMKLGLIKPPAPKLKFNNFMRILGDQAIQDPSQVEKLVRKAYEERYTKMMKENEQRKLTKEQIAEKIKRKFDRDSKKEVKACLYKVQNLTSRKIRFKIDRNCTQLYLTGICIMMKKNNPDNLPSLIYVEGGPLAIKKFKNLVLRRLEWNNTVNSKGKEEIKVVEEEENENEEDTNEVNNQKGDYKIKPECLLVWEGSIKKRLYEKWRMTEVKNENDAKKILTDKGLDNYWNLVNSFKIETE